MLKTEGNANKNGHKGSLENKNLNLRNFVPTSVVLGDITSIILFNKIKHFPILPDQANNTCEEERVKFLPCTPDSPNLYPMEHVGLNEKKLQANGLIPNNIELKWALQNLWLTFPPISMKIIIGTVPSRNYAGRKTFGQPTRYY